MTTCDGKPCIPGGNGNELIRKGKRGHFYCHGYRDAEEAVLKEIDRVIEDRANMSDQHSQIATHTLRTLRQNIERGRHRRR